MTSRRAMGTSLLVSILLILSAAFAGAAQAAVKGRILQVISHDGTVEVLFSGIGLGASDRIDLSTVAVTVDGQKLTAQAKQASESQTTLTRTAVVAIDTSGSMAGARIQAAKAAAQMFARALPADVRLGLVAFSSTARVVVTPTLNHSATINAVQRLVASGDTALYDAAALAAQTSGSTGSRSILLLSDGQDDGSRSTLAQATSKVKQSKVVLSAVSLGQGAAAAAPLRQLATESGGTLLSAPKVGDLVEAFRSAAQSISQEVLVTARLPEGYTGTAGTIAVTATSSAGELTDSAYTALNPHVATADPSLSGPRPVDATSGAWTSSTTFYIALAALFVGVLLLLGFAVTALSKDQTPAVRRRLSIYTLTGRSVKQKQPPSVYGDSVVARSALELAGRVVSRPGFEAALDRKLEAGGVPLKAAEWLLLHVGASLGLGLLMFLLGGADIINALIGLAIGAAVPFGYLIVKEQRRTNAFLAQLPDTLQLLAGSLSAGYSLPQALDAVVREGSQPVATEFGRALVESRLGVPIEDALEGIAVRMSSEDFSWVVMAIRIQREVGGNLAELLSTVSGTLRERERLRRQVQVLSAEGRLSAYILGGLPPLFGLYLVLVRRSYISPLFTDPIGIFMLVVMGVLMVVGGLWLRKVVTVEV